MPLTNTLTNDLVGADTMRFEDEMPNDTRFSEDERNISDNIVRTLISSMFTTSEADKLVAEYGYGEDFEFFSDKENEVDVSYEDKIWYLTHVFSAYVAARCGKGESEKTRDRTDYYSLLSSLIMPNWG